MTLKDIFIESRLKAGGNLESIQATLSRLIYFVPNVAIYLAKEIPENEKASAIDRMTNLEEEFRSMSQLRQDLAIMDILNKEKIKSEAN